MNHCHFNIRIYINFTIMKPKTRKGCKTPRKKTRRIRIQRGGALINSIEDGVIVGASWHMV